MRSIMVGSHEREARGRSSLSPFAQSSIPARECPVTAAGVPISINLTFMYAGMPRGPSLDDSRFCQVDSINHMVTRSRAGGITTVAFEVVTVVMLFAVMPVGWKTSCLKTSSGALLQLAAGSCDIEGAAPCAVAFPALTQLLPKPLQMCCRCVNTPELWVAGSSPTRVPTIEFPQNRI